MDTKTLNKIANQRYKKYDTADIAILSEITNRSPCSVRLLVYSPSTATAQFQHHIRPILRHIQNNRFLMNIARNAEMNY